MFEGLSKLLEPMLIKATEEFKPHLVALAASLKSIDERTARIERALQCEGHIVVDESDVKQP